MIDRPYGLFSMLLQFRSIRVFWRASLGVRLKKAAPSGVSPFYDSGEPCYDAVIPGAARAQRHFKAHVYTL